MAAEKKAEGPNVDAKPAPTDGSQKADLEAVPKGAEHANGGEEVEATGGDFPGDKMTTDYEDEYLGYDVAGDAADVGEAGGVSSALEGGATPSSSPPPAGTTTPAPEDQPTDPVEQPAAGFGIPGPPGLTAAPSRTAAADEGSVAPQTGDQRSAEPAEDDGSLPPAPVLTAGRHSARESDASEVPGPGRQALQDTAEGVPMPGHGGDEILSKGQASECGEPGEAAAASVGLDAERGLLRERRRLVRELKRRRPPLGDASPTALPSYDPLSRDYRRPSYAQFRGEAALKRAVSKLHQRLTVYKEETDSLKAQLEQTNKQLVEGGSVDSQAKLQAAAADQQAAEDELEDARFQITELNGQVAALEQELQEAQQVLEEQTAMLSSQQANNPQLDSMIVETVSKLETELKQQRKKLMGEVDKLKKDKKHLNEELSKTRPKIKQLESQLAESEGLVSELDTLRGVLKSREDGTDNGSDGNVQALLDGSKLKAQVEKLTKERAKLKEKWRQEREMLKKAQEAEKTLAADLTQLSERCEKAEVDKFEAESKLDHLEKYFQKKEVSFQAEMGVLKSRLNHTEGDASSNQGLLLQYSEQLEQNKLLIESLKQEIQDQERSFRSQIQALEKRAHESWVTCRQAERRLEEANREAAQYRAL
ncbi:transport and Golgi organization protein 1-like [Pollicipes pollicipes]|uniref:transport and Golgi organization protein 1-like n=1 Tax=Pollicipes pollicipes TaxID=41117 RepID=UPI0018854C97|nr:transport and Golgi organization protein 1-like [Pollicipes pollicipes]